MDIQYIDDKVKEYAKEMGGTLAIGYKNLETSVTYYYNENHIFPGASIVKVPILLEYIRQKESHMLDPNTLVEVTDKDIVGGAGILFELHRGIQVTLQDLAHLMIVISDNTASNMLLDVVGMDEVNAFSRSVGLSDTVIGRKFMIDPKAKFSKNFTSVRDMVKLLSKLYHKEILSPEGCQEAIDIMSRQQYKEKIPLLLPKKMKIANKTGEITGVRHDVAIVFYDTPYVLCFLTEELPDVVKADRLIAELSLMFFEETKKG